jgi:hypothetical protein
MGNDTKKTEAVADYSFYVHNLQQQFSPPTALYGGE